MLHKKKIYDININGGPKLINKNMCKLAMLKFRIKHIPIIRFEVLDINKMLLKHLYQKIS
jgi:hypothetical protein